MAASVSYEDAVLRIVIDEGLCIELAEDGACDGQRGRRLVGAARARRLERAAHRSGLGGRHVALKKVSRAAAARREILAPARSLVQGVRKRDDNGQGTSQAGQEE